MGERTDDSERERRLSALRALAAQTTQDAGPAPATASQPTFAPETPTDAPDDAGEPDEPDEPGEPGGRRWRLALAGILAALLIVALVVGYALRRGPSAAATTTTAPTLTARTFSLSSTGGVFCTTTPAWAPDSERLAVVGQTNRPQDSCEPYNQQVAVAQIGGGQNVPYQSTNQATGFALVIFDSAKGAVAQRVTLPTPDAATLCGAWAGCSIVGLAPQSLAWSPDGRTVAVFFTYGTISGGAPQVIRENGGLLLFAVGDSSAQPRLLLAAGPSQPVTDSAPEASPLDGLVAQRFTWNIATGAATVAAIPQAPSQSQSLDTIAFAPGWQWSAGGALTPAPASAASAGGSLSPWASGVVGLRHNANEAALYRTSLWAWSPDGQYVTPNLATSIYLRLPGAQLPAATSSGYWPTSADAPDTATNAAIAASLTSQAGVALAHSPNGSLLASYACDTNAQQATLAVRATKSAEPLAQATYTYPYSLYSLACVGNIDAPIWSPDGNRIAIGNEQNAQVTVWQASVHS